METSHGTIVPQFHKPVNARLLSRMLLRELVDAHAAVRATPARNEKIARLAELLARVEPAETPAAVAWLSGNLTQRQIGVGWARAQGGCPRRRSSRR